MALTVETGEGLVNADSLVSRADARTFASAHGLTLPAVDADVDIALRNAHAYLLSIEHLFKGQRTVGTQALPFPRKYMVYSGETIAKDSVPTCVKNAVVQLTADSLDVELLPVSEGNAIVEEQVGPIKTKYGSGSSNSPLPSFPRVMALLSPVLLSNRARTIRI